MRIIAYGRENTIRDLEACLSVNGIDLVGLSGKPEKLMPLIKQNGACMIAVDILADGAEELCSNIKTLCNLPIVIVVEKRGEVDWKKLRQLDVEGYLSLEASKIKLLANIKAIIRRLSQPSNTYMNANETGF